MQPDARLISAVVMFAGLGSQTPIIVSMSQVAGHGPSLSQLGVTDPQLRSTAKTARMLDCSVRTLYRLVERGELSPIRVGRDLRFELDEIRRYLDRHRESP
jgi:excisionase family DNA binding protein